MSITDSRPVTRRATAATLRLPMPHIGPAAAAWLLYALAAPVMVWSGTVSSEIVTLAASLPMTVSLLRRRPR
ncbi:hypothetical protein [Frigidibacter sp. MR17.24]|uniref:hypothetical protein n=1 Tax=Frigidibacter sp. MR17.24 TaxID=3127345 RepID=UPI0030131CAD